MVPRQPLVVGAAQGQAVKILVTGAAGQLGRELVDVATGAGHDVFAASRAELDVTKPEVVRAAVLREQPAVIVHAAAWTAVDACESDREKAMLHNGAATRFVVDAAREVGARVIYISTDYVFDGTKPTPYVEADVPNPQSVYGVSKLAGEQAVDTSIDTVVRISWVCGFHGANMVKTILRIAAQQDTLTFVDDQVGCPTFADDAAAMITRLATEARPGIWHVTNQGAVSWYEFTREVLRAAGHDPARVKPVRTRDLVPARPAPRPANSVLDNAALRTAGISLLDDFRVPLARLVSRLTAQN
ncbi:MAG: dTDP-4-dehydrorhamnose reductase [Actinobacteria bacterium]|nr:dTDP-4-dehydrorhamnose reductase [Actinomycetota bacterium]NDF72059.1 dTDP-4-dehydrorhamnose reductase [Actinomycetota bacterium]